MMNATYSPEDNKLRLYSLHRLDPELYARVKAAGFIYAPKQELFVAPAWTPAREDLLIELCGEIDDEDTSLVDRAEQRAERFETYSEHRANDADRANKSVEAITEHIPLGQPILVGHHSERRARRDAERIEKGMQKAVKMWEQSKYWESRAKGAIRAAKYKERPAVRARRIKGLEADKRKQERNKAEAEKCLEAWNREPLTMEWALKVANYLDQAYICFPLSEYPREENTYEGPMSVWSALDEKIITPEQAKARRVPGLLYVISRAERWINHLNNRLTYEKAMLDEQGASDLLKPAPRPTQLPLCNYRAPEGLDIPNIYNRGELMHYPQIEMTKAEYAKINNDYKGTRDVENSHRVRTAMRNHTLVCIFLTDSKVHTKPEPIERKPAEQPVKSAPAYTPPPEPTEKEKAIEAMKETLKEGIKVVVAPQLFPTPSEIAERMVELAGDMTSNRILEPSAGTGNILKAVGRSRVDCKAVAVEINSNLANQLKNYFHINVEVVNADFLSCNGDLGKFDKVIMNPPFENAADIKHINHALTMLKPGGRLVALCANGPRQQEAFKDRADHWEVLEPGSFKEQGTNVNVALLVMDKAEEIKPVTLTKPTQETLF
jgi:phospholipid N-methyltransferase